MKGVKFVRDDEKLVEPLLRPLFADLLECEDLLERRDDQFTRRVFVRASFAFIEAQIHWFRRVLFDFLAADNLRTGKIEITALSLLFDEGPRLERNGTVRMEPLRVPFLKLSGFVLRTAAEHAGLDATSLFSDNGWREFREAYAVRNRITHPKEPQDLEVSDVIMDSVREAHRWLFNCLVSILRALQPH